MKATDDDTDFEVAWSFQHLQGSFSGLRLAVLGHEEESAQSVRADESLRNSAGMLPEGQQVVVHVYSCQ